jgi:UV DNA damage endonuclease
MIGLCCQYLEPILKKNGSTEYKNIANEAGLQYGQYLKGRYSENTIEETWISNCRNLYSLIQRVHNNGIKLFRFSSSLLPLYDCVPHLLEQSSGTKKYLKLIGDFVISNNMRLTTHPDQFVVISSNNPSVIDKSVKMLAYHAWIMDQMGLAHTPFYSINIHGGTKGNSKILINEINKLPINIKSRLTLENDERAFNIKELYQVFQDTGVPICWDSHHHSFNDAGISNEEALEICKKSWVNIKPLTHLSNTEPELVNGAFSDRRKHSGYMHYIPECQLTGNNSNELDIEFEFKMKNLAIFKAIKEYNIQL